MTEDIDDLRAQRDALLQIVAQTHRCLVDWWEASDSSEKNPDRWGRKIPSPVDFDDWFANHTDWKNLEFYLEEANIGLDPVWTDSLREVGDFAKWWTQQWGAKRDSDLRRH